MLICVPIGLVPFAAIAFVSKKKISRQCVHVLDGSNPNTRLTKDSIITPIFVLGEGRLVPKGKKKYLIVFAKGCQTEVREGHSIQNNIPLTSVGKSFKKKSVRNDGSV